VRSADYGSSFFGLAASASSKARSLTSLREMRMREVTIQNIKNVLDNFSTHKLHDDWVRRSVAWAVLFFAMLSCDSLPYFAMLCWAGLCCALLGWAVLC
jgi:hypothetical protein